MPKFKPLPPLERLHELFEVVEIPPDKLGEWSGLVWKVKRKGTRGIGSVVGNLSRKKPRQDRADWRVMVDGGTYTASRVIYYMTHGEDPDDAQVDHEDQNPLNNNAWNLRLDVEGDIQAVNRGRHRNNTSGAVGVCQEKTSNKWKAYVYIKSKRKHLGYFTCKLKAARVVNNKWIELGWVEIGRQLNDLEKIECNCESCVSRT